jgi:peptidoglycan hydrolase-like protein with peptidoglycan-binding domain
MRTLILLSVFGAAALPGIANADELAKIIQQDLVTLGYDPGNTNGDVTTPTIIAVSKFQAEHDLTVTGELNPQLAGIIKAAISQQDQAAATPAEQDAAALQAAQQACLEQKVAEAQEAQRKQSGIRSLARAVGRTASRFGGNDISRQVAETSSDIYTATAVASSVQSAAQDLGLTEDDVEKCRAP